MSVRHCVEVDASEFDTEELLQELRRRGVLLPNATRLTEEWMVSEIRDALHRGKPNAALALLDRYCGPPDDPSSAYYATMVGQHTMFKRAERKTSNV